jgi:hypothetical protein
MTCNGVGYQSFGGPFFTLKVEAAWLSETLVSYHIQTDFVSVLFILIDVNMRVYPKVSGLATWSENCKCYNSLPLGAVVSLFCDSF